MYHAYYKGIAAKEGPAAEFHYRGNHWVYCFPCDHDLTLLAVSVPTEEFPEFRRDPGGRLQNELQSMTVLASRLAASERAGPIRGTGSIPGYLRIPSGNGWVLVGDAGMVMDPWSGRGNRPGRDTRRRPGWVPTGIPSKKNGLGSRDGRLSSGARRV